MPIGSNAQYAPANIQNGTHSTVDVDLLYRVPAGAPVRNPHRSGLHLHQPPESGAANTVGLLYNHVNASNFYEVKLTPTGLVTVSRVVSGARAQVASGTYAGAGPNKWVKVDVTRAGTTTTVRINDVAVFSNLSQPELGAGQLGLFSEWNPTSYDDVTVTQ